MAQPTTNTPPKLTDPAALSLRLARVDAEAGMFLQEIAADEIHDRISLVNKAFTDVAIVTRFPKFWHRRFPNARIVPYAEVLALDPLQHDLIIHAMSLHWANDPVGQLIQCKRALKPDGLFMACLFGGQTLIELRASLAGAETRVSGGLSPRVAPMAEIRDLGGLLQRADLRLPVADIVTQNVTYRDIFHLARDLRAMGETNALAARHRRPPPRALFDTAQSVYADQFSDDDGRLKATFELAFLSGWSAHPDQQQPLKPGSASHSLADALNQAKSGGSD